MKETSPTNSQETPDVASLEALYALPAVQDDERNTAPRATETIVDIAQTTPEEVVAASGSRLGNLLRRRADGADRASEKFRDTKERARAAMRGFGRSALNVLSKTARFSADVVVVGFGASIATGQALSRGLDRMDSYTARKTAEAQDWAKQKAKDTALKTLNGFEQAGDWLGGKIESGINSAKIAAKDAREAGKTQLTDVAEATRYVYEAYRGRYLRNREKALTRRLERRHRWSLKREELASRARSGYERNKARVDVARGVGSAVLSHLGETFAQVKDTKSVAKTTYAELNDSRTL